MRFFIVDAFSDALFGGNPAGVVLLDESESFPPDEIMRKTAAELRYSETAFVKQTGKNAFSTRYFTPSEEVDLCGHATIGTFYALFCAGVVAEDTVCRNLTRAGEIGVAIEKNMIWMDMASPRAIGKLENDGDLRELYGIMGLDYQDHCKASGRGGEGDILLPELISTGLPDILLPVADIRSLAAIKPDFPALAGLSARYEAVGVHAFTRCQEDGLIHCRNFAPLYAIDEEAATGTSNGALTYYLYQKGLIAEGAETVFIQGEAMGRPSRIVSKLTADPNEENIRIRIGGKAVILAEGSLRLLS